MPSLARRGRLNTHRKKAVSGSKKYVQNLNQPIPSDASFASVFFGSGVFGLAAREEPGAGNSLPQFPQNLSTEFADEPH